MPPQGRSHRWVHTLPYSCIGVAVSPCMCQPIAPDITVTWCNKAAVECLCRCHCCHSKGFCLLGSVSVNDIISHKRNASEKNQCQCEQPKGMPSWTFYVFISTTVNDAGPEEAQMTGDGQVERIRVATLEGSYLNIFLIEMSGFQHSWWSFIPTLLIQLIHTRLKGQSVGALAFSNELCLLDSCDHQNNHNKNHCGTLQSFGRCYVRYCMW